MRTRSERALGVALTGAACALLLDHMLSRTRREDQIMGLASNLKDLVNWAKGRNGDGKDQGSQGPVETQKNKQAEAAGESAGVEHPAVESTVSPGAVAPPY